MKDGNNNFNRRFIKNYFYLEMNCMTDRLCIKQCYFWVSDSSLVTDLHLGWERERGLERVKILWVGVWAVGWREGSEVGERQTGFHGGTEGERWGKWTQALTVTAAVAPQTPCSVTSSSSLQPGQTFMCYVTDSPINHTTMSISPHPINQYPLPPTLHPLLS